MYRRLNVDRILTTAEQLQHRIGERFPASGLYRVAGELIDAGRQSVQHLDKLSRPVWPLRLGAGLGIVAMLLLAGWAMAISLGMSSDIGSRADLLQAVPALIDELVLLGIATFFFARIESRVKRSVALRALYEFRSLAHVIDMHQLTKDPSYLLRGAAGLTSASPQRTMSRFELERYYDYCSEMLSITGKMAALYVEGLKDPVVLGAVRDIESLTTALSAKIWQKTMVLDLVQTNAQPNPDDVFETS